MTDLTTHQLRVLAMASLESGNSTERTLAANLTYAADQLDRLQLQHREATSLIGKLSADLARHDRGRQRSITTAPRMVDL